MRFDALFVELIDSTNMINALMAGVGAEEARARPAPQAWSILEVVCHLYDEEREDFREHLRFILAPQGEWHSIDPQAWVAERGYNERNFRDMKERFFAERNGSLDWLRSIEKSDWDARAAGRPTSPSAGEMLASWVAHDNLHLRQLVELRRARIERLAQPYSLAYAGQW